VGSTASTLTPDGKDQNCNGIVDEETVDIIENVATGRTSNDICDDVAGRYCVSVGVI